MGNKFDWLNVGTQPINTKITQDDSENDQGMRKIREDMQCMTVVSWLRLPPKNYPEKQSIVSRLEVQCRWLAGLPVRISGCDQYGPPPTQC